MVFNITKEEIYELIETSLSAKFYEEDENPGVLLFDDHRLPDLDMEKEKKSMQRWQRNYWNCMGLIIISYWMRLGKNANL